MHFRSKKQTLPVRLIEKMNRDIDSPKGRRPYSQGIGTVEPVFGNLHNNKGLDRFTLRGQIKVNTQWNLFCLVHNIESSHIVVMAQVDKG